MSDPTPETMNPLFLEDWKVCKAAGYEIWWGPNGSWMEVRDYRGRNRAHYRYWIDEAGKLVCRKQ